MLLLALKHQPILFHLLVNLDPEKKFGKHQRYSGPSDYQDFPTPSPGPIPLLPLFKGKALGTGPRPAVPEQRVGPLDSRLFSIFPALALRLQILSVFWFAINSTQGHAAPDSTQITYTNLIFEINKKIKTKTRFSKGHVCLRCKRLKVCTPRLLSNKKLPGRMTKAFCSDRHDEKDPSDA